MKYQIKVKEIDNGTDYPLIVLSGLTGLGQETIKHFSEEGKFRIKDQDGKLVVNGGEFKNWSHSIDNTIEVEKTNYPKLEVNE